jgi:hypothetical protein
LAPGLALGKLIGPHCEQLYRTDSVINATVQRNAIVLPILKAGNNLNQPTADGRRSINTVQMDPNRFMSPFAAQRQKGWLLIGKDDSAEILEVEGKAVAMLQEQKKLIIERINTAVHQLSQNIQSHGKEAASAAAKQEDRRDTEIILNEYKTEVEIFVLKIIKLILELRAEGDVSLHMQGLNTEDDEDKKEVIAELVAYGSFPNSEVFRVNFEYDRAEALCDSLSQDDKVKMREQIEKSVKVKMDQDIKMKQQQLKAGEPDGDERQPAPQGKS